MKLELINEYHLGRERREEIRVLLQSCFPGDPDEPYDAFTLSRTYLKQLPPQRLLASEKDKIIGHLGLEHRVVGTTIGPVEILGVIDLCVLEPYQGCGIASQMLSWVESLAKRTDIPFLMLFAHDRRLYERNGFIHATNLLRWVKIHEHEIIGIGEEPLEELMIKSVATENWPEGLVDLLGYQF